ncbi:MAG: hypothetical protein J5871_01165 [Bacteroidales bacterium]|nr:hypothetical protein [Bacteroidales bacterium]
MLAVAKILKSDGTDGGVLVGLSGPDAEELKAQEPVFIHFDGLPVPFFIEDIRPKGGHRAVLHLSGVDSLRDAEEIVGKEIFLSGDEGAQEEADFCGWMVYDRDNPVGCVDGLEDIPGNPCLRIGDALVPLHEDFILRADAQRRELFLSLPDGLLDLARQK